MTSTMRFDRWEKPDASQSVSFDQLAKATVGTDYSVSAANTAYQPITGITQTANRTSSNSGDYFTVSSSEITLKTPGIYMATITYSLGVAATGRTYIQGTIQSAIYRNNMQTGEDRGIVTFMFVTTADNVSLTGHVSQTTGGTRTVTGRFDVTYLGSL